MKSHINLFLSLYYDPELGYYLVLVEIDLVTKNRNARPLEKLIIQNG